MAGDTALSPICPALDHGPAAAAHKSQPVGMRRGLRPILLVLSATLLFAVHPGGLFGAALPEPLLLPDPVHLNGAWKQAGISLEDDWRALIALYNATGGASWSRSDNWSTSTTTQPTASELNNWFGVTVTNDRVTTLSLYNNGLVGTLPDAIGNLTELTSLLLTNNILSGTVPSTMVNLVSLETFYFYNQSNSANTLCIPLEVSDLVAWYEDITNIYGSAYCVSQVEYDALVALYNATGGDAWTSETDDDETNNWNTSADRLLSVAEVEYNWHGLGFTSGRVTRIDLSNNNLIGELPVALGDLTDLGALFVGSNSGLSGKVPAEWAYELGALAQFSIAGTSVCAPLHGGLQTWLGELSYNLGDSCTLYLTGVDLERVSTTELKLTWTLPPVTGKYGSVNGYRLKYRVTDADEEQAGSQPGNWSSQVTVASTGTSHSITELGASIHHDVQVWATTNDWPYESEYCEVSTSASTATLPGPPLNLVVRAVSAAELSATWSVPVDPCWGAITGYSVQYREPGELTWIDASHAGTVTNASISGLNGGTAYEVQVAARTSTGVGSYVSKGASTIETTATRPGAPESLSLSAGSSGVTVTWAVPTSDGGASIEGYVVQYRLADAGQMMTGPWIDWDHTSTSTETIITGLLGVTTYDVQVAATNIAGTGDFASFQQVTTPVGVPGAPSDLSIKVTSHSELEVSWTAPLSNGGEAVTGYSLQYREAGSTASWQNAAHTGVSVSATVSSLAGGTSYNVQVAAKNSAGTGAYAQASAATPTAAFEADWRALVSVFGSAGGSNWDSQSDTDTGNDWSASTAEVPTANEMSAWEGVTLTSGRVTELILSDKNLIGTLPDEIGNLTELTNLSIQNNELLGAAPSTMVELTALGTFNFGGADQRLCVPQEDADMITWFTGIAAADGPYCLLEVEYDALVALYNTAGGTGWTSETDATQSDDWDVALTRAVTADEVNLWHSVTIADALDGKQLVTSLNLGQKNLTGTLTSQIGHLAGLQYLDLYENSLTGALPNTVVNLTALETFYFDGEGQTLCVPQEDAAMITWFEGIATAYGSYCLLEVEYDALVALYNTAGGTGWTSETDLDEEDNLFTANDWDVSGARVITTSELANWYGVSSPEGRVVSLSLEDNNLVGAIPNSLWNLTELTSLYLSSNMLSGAIPSGLEKLTKLQDLYLGSNTFSGELPVLWAQHLSVLADFRFLDSGLCAPLGASFQTWLQAVAIVEGDDCEIPLTGLSLQWDSATEITVSWDMPQLTGRAGAIENYEVQNRESAGDGESPGDWEYVGNVAKTDTTIGSLDETKDYDFQVRASLEESPYNSAWSEISTLELTASPPGPPGNLSVTADNATTLSVSWDAPTETGGVPIRGYTVQYRLTGASGWTGVSHTGTDTRVKIRGLAASTSYDVQVQAKNSGGGGSFASQTASTLALSANVPGTPGSLSVTVSANSLSVAWVVPSNTGSTSITGYSVQYRLTNDGGSLGEWMPVSHTGTNTNAQITGLEAATSYDVQVAAINGAGTGAYTAAQTAITSAATLPGVPTALGVSVVSQTELSVMWTAPLETGGC